MAKRSVIGYTLILFLISTIAWAGAPSRPHTYSAGDLIKPDQNNANENAIYNYLSGGVDTYKAGSIKNVDINSSAAIAVTKISGTAANLSDTQTITGDKDFTGAFSLDGTEVTASAAEINILDGVTGVTYDEIDYLDGVSGTIIAGGTSAGGDLTGTYPNPTIGANKIDDANIDTAFMACFSKVSAHETNVTLKAGTFTNKWIIFSGYMFTYTEVECDKKIATGSEDEQSLGEGWRVAGEDTTPVFGYNGVSDIDLTNDRISIFKGRFYSESGITAPGGTDNFSVASPEGLCVKNGDAANKFTKDSFLYVDSGNYDLMLHIGSTFDSFVVFSIFITVLPDTGL